MKKILVIGLLAVAAACSSPEPAPRLESATPAAIVETPCLDNAEGARLADDASTHMQRGLEAVQAFDMEGAATELNAAAEDWNAIGDLYVGIDSTQVTAGHTVADLLDDSAEALRAFDMESATRSIRTASAIIQSMTRSVNSYTGEVC